MFLLFTQIEILIDVENVWGTKRIRPTMSENVQYL